MAALLFTQPHLLVCPHQLQNTAYLSGTRTKPSSSSGAVIPPHSPQHLPCFNSYSGHALCVTALLDAGCDADARDVKGLHFMSSVILTFAVVFQLSNRKPVTSPSRVTPLLSVCAFLLSTPALQSSDAGSGGRRDDMESQIARCASLSPAARAIAPLLQVMRGARVENSVV